MEDGTSEPTTGTEELSRIGREDLFMNLALLYRERGTCPRNRVGCVLVYQNRIVSAGYNSSPKGMPHCTEVGCWVENGHCLRVSHAEVSAIHGLPRRYEELECYVTASPCVNCVRELSQQNVKIIRYYKEYGPMHPLVSKVYQNSKIKIAQFTPQTINIRYEH